MCFDFGTQYEGPNNVKTISGLKSLSILLSSFKVLIRFKTLAGEELITENIKLSLKVLLSILF